MFKGLRCLLWWRKKRWVSLGSDAVADIVRRQAASSRANLFKTVSEDLERFYNNESLDAEKLRLTKEWENASWNFGPPKLFVSPHEHARLSHEVERREREIWGKVPLRLQGLVFRGIPLLCADYDI